MKHIRDIYPMVKQVRQRIIETMQQRGIVIVQFCQNEEDYEHDHADDDPYVEWADYRYDHCPNVVYFDKYGCGYEYQVLQVELKGDDHPYLKLYCNSGELGDDSFLDSDVYDMTWVYEMLEKELGLDEEPEKVWLVKQESNVDGQIIFNVTPCKDKESAAKVVADEVHTLLTESTPYLGALDYIEGRKEVDDDCPFSWDGNIDGQEGFYISTVCDDYYEQITIEEKEII